MGKDDTASLLPSSGGAGGSISIGMGGAVGSAALAGSGSGNISSGGGGGGAGTGGGVAGGSDAWTFALMTSEETLARLDVHRDRGLDAAAVNHRRGLRGFNELEVKDDEPLWRKFLDQFKEPLILLLLASATISLLLGQFDDAISIALAVIIVVTVGFVQEYRSEKSLEALNKLVPHKCHCLREGKVQQIYARELVPGDIVVLALGDRVPADIRMIESVELEIDESNLTGETIPMPKHTGAIPHAPGLQKPSIHDRKNMGFMGTLVRNGRGVGVVTAISEDTEFGHVFFMLQEVEDRQTPLQIKMQELGQSLSWLSLGVIGVICLLGLAQGRNMLETFTVGVSLAVAAIPEGLPIVVTVTLALGVMRMAKHNAIVKKLPSVESLGCANVVCVDKTGTLTQNEMTVTRVFTVARGVLPVSGQGYSGHGAVLVDGAPITVGNANASFSAAPVIAHDVLRVLVVGNLCNNAHISAAGELVGQPTEGALIAAAMKVGLTDQRRCYERVAENPFNSDNKWMAVKCRRPTGGPSVMDSTGDTYYVKGALDAVLDRCSFAVAANGNIVALSPSDKALITRTAAEVAGTGLRVVAMAYGFPLDSLVFTGFVGIIDPPRVGVREAVQQLLGSGVAVVMITGDAQETAVAIGEQIGIFDRNFHTAISGQQVEAMDQHELAHVIHRARIFYRTSPKHKMTIVAAYQENGDVVAMTGDGVNDAPALRLADIGVAMGRSGTDVSKEAADVILVDDNFLTIMAAIEEGKSIFYNIKNFLRFQLSTSVAALSLIAISTFMGYQNPLNAMQILWINIIMDGPPAQSLGVEPVDHDVMKKPPRKAKDPIITKMLIQRVLISALFILVGTLYVYIHEMKVDNVVDARDNTMAFTTFVLFDMFNALASRSEEKSIFTIGFFTNSAFLYSVGGSLIGQLAVIYVPFLQSIFQTEALALGDVVYITVLASTVFWAEEARKMYMRGSSQA
ncbi:calcium-transporting P-type ATPase [Capsaspora owczarzaki ATCC 30864]|uniref:P-type Ca(2+) transporter n=1 Tax=Capsaspora owczarzaki (strain ATCC 30864) TaxID=595528 RepID=A0A0D2X1U9_CAPO3|nr:calcium-transporting P-type ATPase [Capsaspora owczarzaki ATCC 30864]